MNILASYNWLGEFLKHDLTLEEFTKRHTAAGNSVEHVRDLKSELKNIVVGHVQSLGKHPNADKLTVVETNIGTAVVQIVCGGTNVKKGARVVVALPGAWVRWHGEGEPVQLHETEIRGLKSHGMICAPQEVGFDIKLEGERPIWDITKLTKAEAGTPISEALELEDFILDIEVTTNRPDCQAMVGQAREGFAAVGGKFSWKPKILKDIIADARPFPVRVEAPELCLKYESVLLEGVKVKPSPWFIQKRLLLAGHTPINNVVDITNYVLLELGHPLHAFDADKLEGGELVVRQAKKGETLVGLDGRTHAFSPEHLVIADRSKPVAVAGVIGGEDSGTHEATTRIVLESATFNHVSVRRTARALNVQTDASLLFEKGLSAQATSAALARAVELLKKYASANVASAPTHFEAKPYQAPVFAFDPKNAAELIGVDLPAKDQVAFLKRLGFAMKKEGKGYHVTVPYWRDHDIESSRDFVEEVARLFGYANVPSILPVGRPAPAVRDTALVWERRAKEALRGAGFTESYGYSFVSAKQLERYGISPETAVQLANPLSVDQAYIRPSLIPSLLTVVEYNQRRVSGGMDVFELAPIHRPNPTGIPEMRLRLTLALVGKDGREGFLAAKGALERLFGEMGVHAFRLERLASGTDDARWHRTRSAAIWIGEHAHVGMVGQVSASTAKAFGIEHPTFLVDLDFEALVPHATTKVTYKPMPAFQEAKRDLAVVVEGKTVYGEVEAALKAASGLLESVELFDVYVGQGVPEGKKSLAMHFVFRATDRTLSTEDVDRELNAVQTVLETKFSGILRA